MIQDRLNEYSCKSPMEEENAIKEIFQEICLAGLSRSGFFKKAAFQGGTCLRIFYQLPRFSEDLDFILQSPDPHFEMKNNLAFLQEELRTFGFEFEIQDKSKANQAVKKAFLKNDSYGKVLTFQHSPRVAQSIPKKIQIKIEIDAKPPMGSEFEDKTLTYPFPFSAIVQDPRSLCAGKTHALLCRPYLKGRDWYDFLWYARKKTKLNYHFLNNALEQTGPWAGTKLNVNESWIYTELKNKINQVDWDLAKQDIQQLVQPHEIPSLEFWKKRFFWDQLNQWLSA